MIIFYDKDTDYSEVFFEKDENYAEPLMDAVMVFKSEKNDKIVGYAFDEARRTLFENSLLSPSVKLAALLKILRSDHGLTQEQAAQKIGDITVRHYQRLESGEENPTLGTIEKLIAAFPDEDFSVILRHPSTSSVA